MKRTAVWCALLVAGSMLAGCGNTAGQAGQRLYPFDSAVYFDAKEQALLNAAQEAAVQRCMRQRGFTYQPARAAPAQDAEPDNPYGLLSKEAAGTDGYGITSRLVSERPPATPGGEAPGKEPLGGAGNPHTTQAWNDALVGTRRGRRVLKLPGGDEVTVAVDGCVALSRREVFGADWDDVYYLFQELSNQVIERTDADHAVRAALREWSRCMARASRPGIASPDDAEAAVTQHVQSAGRTAAGVRAAARYEIGTAVQDAACQQQAGLRTVFRTAQQQAEEHVGARYSRELDHLVEMRDRALERAAAEVPSR
ncbi:hypothetical protein [Streptomyces sp. NPDC021356]|uniref:hypothetical protein n=1 Tax=Streptomyces sp. NPDC021356 TaxID=3154900 RepID=UPI0033CF9AF4